MPPNPIRFKNAPLFTVLFFLASPLPAKNRIGLFNGLSLVNDNAWMASSKLQVNGWAAAGIIYNANDPGDNYNGPVVFADRANEFNLHQLGLQLSRDVDTKNGGWDIGGKITVMYGSDARFNTINPYGNQTWDNNLIGGSERLYKLAIPNAYLDVFVPMANGISVRLGRFYTIMGYETGLSPDNFFYTHPYTFQYGEPFTHTGLTMGYPLTKNLTITVGAVTGGHTLANGVLDGNGGWDGFDNNLENWNFLGGINWVSQTGASSIALSVVTGDVNSNNNLRAFQRLTGRSKQDNRTFYSLVLQHDLTERWHVVLQHDHGFEQQHPLNNFHSAQWYGIQTQTRYQLSDNLGIGLRAEWFRDADGVRVGQVCPGCAQLATGQADYYTASLGLNWKMAGWLTVRPEIRYDWSDGVKAFDSLNKSSQLLVGTDIVVAF